MNTEHEVPRGRKGSRDQAEGEQSNPSERLAYSILEFCEVASLKRSTVYEEIKAGRLIARKARGRTIILSADGNNYLLSLPPSRPRPPSRKPPDGQPAPLPSK